MTGLMLVLHVVMAFMIIGLVLIQHGKGAEVGAAFGSGASNTVFGSQGAGSFLAKATVVLAILFAITSFSLTKFSYQSRDTGVVDIEKISAPTNSENLQNSLDAELSEDKLNTKNFDSDLGDIDSFSAPDTPDTNLDNLEPVPEINLIKPKSNPSEDPAGNAQPIPKNN